MSGNQDRRSDSADAELSRPRSRDDNPLNTLPNVAGSGQEGKSSRRAGGVKPIAPPLQRTGTNVSIHAETSLRRMATHETGGYDHTEHEHSVHDDDAYGVDDDRGKLKRHSEEHELDLTSSERHEESRTESHGAGGGGEGKREIALQDQTNLLPVRQVIFVFLGLTCAIFCSLLDQTM